MVAGKMGCCGCGCKGKNCYKGGRRPSCADPCCFCEELQGLTTCDNEYFTALAACQAEGNGGNVCSDYEIEVELDINYAAQVVKRFNICGEPPELSPTAAVNLSPVQQITNVGIYGPAEDAGDAPFAQPCSDSVYHECNSRGPDGDCDGNPVPFNSTCWTSCPSAGNMWKPEHHEVEGTNCWDADQFVTFTLDPLGGCSWIKRLLLPGSGTRIWLEPHGGQDYYDTDTATCTGGTSVSPADCNSPAGSGCCHCIDCPQPQDIDCNTAESGCITGTCQYTNTPEELTGSCGCCGSEPLARPPYAEGGYIKRYVTVRFVLTYELTRSIAPADAGNAGDLTWRHAISLEPYFLFSGDTLSVTNNIVDYQYAEANRPPGDWAPILGGPGYTTVVNQCHSGCGPTTDPCGSLSALSTFDDWDRCEYAERFLTRINPAGCGSSGAFCKYDRDDWCDQGGPHQRLMPSPHLPIAEHLQNITGLTIPSGCTCPSPGGNMVEEGCTSTAYANGEFFNGLAFEHFQGVAGEFACFVADGCPSSTEFSSSGFSAVVISRRIGS